MCDKLAVVLKLTIYLHEWSDRKMFHSFSALPMSM